MVETPMHVQQHAARPVRSDQIMTFRKLSWILIRRRYGIFAVIVISFSCAIAWHFLKTPEYRAISFMMINDDKSQNDLFSKVVGPEAAIGEHKSLKRDEELLRSMPIAEMTVRALERDNRRTALELFGQRAYLSPLKRMLEPVISPVASVFAVQSPHSEQSSEDELRQLAVKLNRRISVTPVKESNVIKVSVASPFADESALITNTLCKIYRDADIRRTSEKYAQANRFIAQMLDDQAQKLADADAALSNYMLTHRIYDVTGNTQELLDKLVEVDAVYNELQAEYRIERNRLAFLDRKLSDADKALASRIARNVTAQLSSIVDEMRSNERDYFRVVKEKGVGDPESKALKQKLVAVKERYEQLSRSRIAGQIGYAGRAQKSGFDLVSDRMRIERRLNDLSYSAKEYGNMRQYYEGQLTGLPVKLQEYVKLERDREAVSKTYVFLKEKLDESRILLGSEVGSVSIVSNAFQPIKPEMPDLNRSLLLGLLFSGVFASAYVYVAETHDKSIRDTGFFKHTGIGRFFSVPSAAMSIRNAFPADGLQSFPVMMTGSGGYAESIRGIRAYLVDPSGAGASQLLLVSGTAEEEGKAALCTNLAAAWALAGRKTLIVDCTLDRPLQHELLGCDQAPGLTDWLRNPGRIDQNELFQRTEVENLTLLAAGRTVPNASDLLASTDAAQLFERFREQFDIVFVDAPPLSASDSLRLSHLVDGIILVARLGYTAKHAVIDLAEDPCYRSKILCAAVIGADDRAVSSS